MVMGISPEHPPLTLPSWDRPQHPLCCVPSPAGAPAPRPKRSPPHCIPALTSSLDPSPLPGAARTGKEIPEGRAQSSRPGGPHREAGEATRGGHHQMSGAPLPLTTSPQAGAGSRQAGGSQVHLRASLRAPLHSLQKTGSAPSSCIYNSPFLFFVKLCFLCINKINDTNPTPGPDLRSLLGNAPSKALPLQRALSKRK